MTSNIIGCFGGTFDPPHLGHIHLLKFVFEQLDCGKIKLLPCHIPAHKSPTTSTQHRVNMCMLMQNEFDFIEVDLREVESNEVSYTAKTLGQLRRQYPDQSICFIIGMDSFLNLTHWYEWPKLFELANIIVVDRQPELKSQQPTGNSSSQRTYNNKELLQKATLRVQVVATVDTNDNLDQREKKSTENTIITPVSIEQCKQILDNNISGCLVFMNNPLFNLSSTHVREKLKYSKAPTTFLLPSIAKYVAEHGLYLSSKGEN